MWQSLTRIQSAQTETVTGKSRQSHQGKQSAGRRGLSHVLAGWLSREVGGGLKFWVACLLHEWVSFYLHMFYFPAFPICYMHTSHREAGKSQWQGKNHLCLARPAHGQASHHIQSRGEAQLRMARQSRHNNKQALLGRRQIEDYGLCCHSTRLNDWQLHPQ